MAGVKVLAFDCSTQACSVAVRIDGRSVVSRRVPMARGQSEALLPMVIQALAEANLAWADLTLIGVTVGPGTFTGVRIGLAAARGMALAGSVPLAGVTTTEAVANSVPAAERGGRTLVVAIDGKRADLFLQAFSEDLTALGQPIALLPEVAARQFPGPLLLAGDAVGRLFALRPDAVLSQASGVPDPAIVAALAEARFLGGLALPPNPLYLRPADVTLAKLGAGR